MPSNDVIKPYSGGEPGGSKPSRPVVHRVEGGQQIVVSPEAQQASKAAQDLSLANATFTEMLTKRGANRLDDASQQRLNEVNMELLSNPPKPATIINLHPWPLSFGYSDLLLRGITVPACPPGQTLMHFHIRAARKEWEYEENGTLKFKIVRPIQLAAQFVREFSNPDNDGGGVIIYEGETNPSKLDLIEGYDPTGRALTTAKVGLVYDEENQAHQVTQQIPVKRSFPEMLKEALAHRNSVYMRKVQKADHDYHLPDGRGKWLLHDKHFLMAEVLLSEGLIVKMPDWNLSDRMEQGLSPHNCKACGDPIKQDAYKCFKCENIVNIVEAFRDGAPIPESKFEIATTDELEQIAEIKKDRAEARKAK
jgi:hypothetical protein